MGGDKKQHQKRLKDSDFHVKLPDYEQKLRKCKTHHADDKKHIGLIRSENIAGQCHSAKNNHKNALDCKHIEMFAKFVICQVNHENVNEQKRNTSHDHRRNRRKFDDFKQLHNQQDAKHAKKNRSYNNIFQ